MPWFAVRTIYLCRQKSDGTNIFEERVVCFEAVSVDEAFEKAERESDQYVLDSSLVAFPEQESYEQDGDALIDGFELWSTMFEARQSLEEFYAERYARYEYHPE